MAENEGRRNDVVVDTLKVEDSPEVEDGVRLKLRRRWELASVLNFLSVFEAVVGKELKMSAEDIESALIKADSSLAKLHVTLLKGIPPVSKNLSSPDVWVTILCKKLAEWWPWVAEGNVPLVAAKGEEISKYKELDPTIRLVMLKALCEIRIEQDDIASYISDALKEGAELSRFRKDKIAEDGTGVSYWYDGNSVIGHRLYKEVNRSQFKPRHKGKGCLDLPPTDVEWETLATNLIEFRKALEQFSTRKAGVEAVVRNFIEAEAIPVQEQLQKKRERALKRRQRQENLLSGYQPYSSGVTRSCRTRRQVSYTFDEYDRTIDEALKLSRKGKDQIVQSSDGEQRERKKRENGIPDEKSAKDSQSNEESPVSMDEDMENKLEHEVSDSEGNANASENTTENEDEKNYVSDSSDHDLENDKAGKMNHVKLQSEGEDDHDASMLPTKNSSESTDFHLKNNRNPRAKNRLRQRPTQNTAIESNIVPDSEDGSSSENVSQSEGSEDLSEDTNSESDVSS